MQNHQLTVQRELYSRLKGINVGGTTTSERSIRFCKGLLYEFAGELRQVNLSKGGFLFPAARFLPSIVEEFDKGFLKPLPYTFADYEHLIEHVAPLHAELLFIHPFREGNGRTARLFADLIALKSEFERFSFEKITEKKIPGYISAVQATADKNYNPMIQLFRRLKK